MRKWRETAVCSADRPANQCTDTADENYRSGGCSGVGVLVGFGSKGRSQSESDYRSDQNVAAFAVIHPR
jgi:hypothetical protein